MGLFKKNEDKKKNNNEVSRYSEDNSEIPQLPELPKLPDFPGMEEDENENFSLPQLPSFPNSSLGDKFSQNTIKDAVSGGKEGDSEGYNAEDFEIDENEIESPMMQNPSDGMQRSIMSQEMPSKQRIQNYSQRQYTTMKKPEPVFIRLDKFEESLEIFEDAKEQISEIEHLLRKIKELKQKEEEELSSWENQIQEIKKQVEKVDQDIFSKI
jgi:hypothetical protein